MSDANTATGSDAVAMSETNATASADANAIRLWLSHPNLYRSILTFALMSIGLGLNFLLLPPPPFNGYDVNIRVVGGVFLALGLTKLLFLHVRRNLRALRLTMAAEVGFTLFWGIGTSVTYFQGLTTLQLAVLYGALAAFEVFLLIEPFANPMTGRRGA